jgi:hypothetical protein
MEDFLKAMQWLEKVVHPPGIRKSGGCNQGARQLNFMSSIDAKEVGVDPNGGQFSGIGSC